MSALKRTLALVFWTIIISSPRLYAQPPLPVIKGATVVVRAAFDSSNQTFLYTYSVTNFLNSVGPIHSFEFDISNPPGSEDLQLNGLTDFPGADDASLNWFRSKLGNTIIPLVFVSSNGWKEAFSIHRQAGWYFTVNKGYILPGQSLDGLVIQSPGLVGIRSFIVEPPFDPNDYLPNVDDLPDTPDLPQKIARINQELAQMEREIKFTGYTLGPTALPANCDPACMVRFLIGEKEQAFQLAWIDNKGVAQALDAKLNEAKRKLLAGQTQVAINILKSFILDLEAQHQGQTGQGSGATNGKAQTSGKHVTDNAYYLLKPNAEFILYKLGVTSFP